MSTIERRPGPDGHCTVTYPAEWLRRHGEPPREKRALASWIRLNLCDDQLDKTGVPMADRKGKR